jgi:hypothetical protein
VPGGLGEEQERVDTTNTGSIAAAAAHELASYEVAYHLKPMKVVYREVDVQASPSTARRRPQSWQSQPQQQQYHSSEDTDSSTEPDNSSRSSSSSTGEALNGETHYSSADTTVNGAAHATAGNSSSSSSSSSSSEQEQSPDLTAVAVLVRQFPQPWKVYLDTGDTKGYRIAGSWEAMPSASAVRNIIMDAISSRANQ